MSTSISVIEPLFFLPFSHFSQNPNTLLCNCLLALLWILVIFWLDNNRICIAKAFRNVCRLFALTFLQTLLEIKRIVFYWRSCLESQVFLNLIDWHDGSSQCCCHTVTRSRLKHFWSLAMFTLLHSPYKLLVIKRPIICMVYSLTLKDIHLLWTNW